MLRATVSPPLGALCIYSFLEQYTDCAVCCRSAGDSTVSTLFQKAVYTVKVPLKVGKTVVRNM